ncbi:hypothetical protein [Actinomadura luteofluorescens]|uniref:hypothetical protein n=1 Tax=Actinomadura luteofluorescens TaxID=46163 RepID=UPI0030D4312D
MDHLFARVVDGRLRVYEVEAAAEGPLQELWSVPVAADPEICGLAVAPLGDRAVYATQHEIVCLGRDGAEVWRYALLPSRVRGTGTGRVPRTRRTARWSGCTGRMRWPGVGPLTRGSSSTPAPGRSAGRPI